MWRWGSFRAWLPAHSIVVKQPERAVDPFPTPPLPAHPLASSGTPQMPPDLLLYPSFDHRETSIRIADPEIVHPTTKNRIDHLDHLSDGLADILSEDFPEPCKQRRSLLQLRRIVGTPHPPTAGDATIFKTAEPEKLSPLARSTIRLLSSLISTRSFANSSRSRLSTAFTSQS